MKIKRKRKQKKTAAVSLANIDLMSVTASPEDIAAIRLGLANLEHRIATWRALLAVLEATAARTKAD